jgi:hypothetical protein
VQRLWVFRRLGDVCLHHLEDEGVVLVDQRIVGELAFAIGMTLRNQGRLYPLCRLRAQPEPFELVDFGAGRIADSGDCAGERCRLQVDHAFPALTDEVETVIAAGDDAADP